MFPLQITVMTNLQPCFDASILADVDRWIERGTHPPHVYPQPFKVYYGAVSKFGHHESHSLGHLIIIPCYPRFWDKPDKPSMKRHMIFRMFPQKLSKLLKWMFFGKGWSHSPLRILAWSETAWTFSNGDGNSVIGVFHGTHIVKESHSFGWFGWIIRTSSRDVAGMMVGIGVTIPK
jgi:hypothetical protein